jgi:hypothetical protein
MGQSPWFGYQTALQSQGETRLRISWLDTAGQKVESRPNELFVSGQPQPGEIALAIGMLKAPAQPGQYQATFVLSMKGMEAYVSAKPLYNLNVTVESRTK